MKITTVKEHEEGRSNGTAGSVPASTTEYDIILKQLPSLLEATLKSSFPLDAVCRIRDSRRVVLTGCGSSWPVALAGAHLLSDLGLPASAEMTSQVLLKRSFASDDVVILVSQGWNRSDACRITDKVLKSDASLAVITGNPERRLAHLQRAGRDDAAARLFTIPIEPKSEELFCRPASPITSFAQLGALADHIAPSARIVQQIQASLTSPVEVEWTSIPEKVVVLGSGILRGAAEGLALMLREGAGVDTEAYECEAYGHGHYVPHQYQLRERPEQLRFIVLRSPGAEEGPDRILPLLRDTRSQYEVWDTKVRPEGAFATMLLAGSHLVVKLNHRTAFDMNCPPGIEENRDFHEVGGL